MSNCEKEEIINEQLRQLDPRYAIANLRLANPATARYEFDIVRDFARKHAEEVERVLQSVLGIKGKRTGSSIATTILLRPPAYRKLQQLQRARRKPSSEIVAELLLSA